MYGCQQHLVKSTPEVMAVLEYLCTEVNKLTNCGIYYCRQMLFKAGKFLSKAELDFELKSNPLINADCNGAANILRKVSTQLEINLAKVCREVLMLPQRYKLDFLTKKYRQQCVAWL